MLCGGVMGEIFGRERRQTEGKWIVVILLLGSLLTFLVDALFDFGYWGRAVFKLVLFIGMPLILHISFHEVNVFTVLDTRREKGSFRKSVLMGVLVYIMLLVLYILIRGFISLETIENAISKNFMVDKSNFIWVALYISFVNSFLEEFFFRGFGFLKLKRSFGRGGAYVFSSLLFALYHIGMVDGWASPLITGLAILGLFLSGMFFNVLNEKNENIYNSYMVHMFANFAINTVGLHMYGIIRLPFLG